MKPFFGVLAAVINLAGYIPYSHDIFRGKVKPQRVTWGIWSILTTIAFFNLLANGGGFSSIFFGTIAGMVLLTFGLSFKYGVGGSSRFDKSLLTLSMILFLYWLFLGDRHYSTYIALTIDSIGALPTLLKTATHPNTETYPQWTLAAIGAVFSIAALGNYALIALVYPLYVLLMNLLVVSTKWTAENTKVFKLLARQLAVYMRADK